MDTDIENLRTRGVSARTRLRSIPVDPLNLTKREAWLLRVFRQLSADDQDFICRVLEVARKQAKEKAKKQAASGGRGLQLIQGGLS